MAKLLSGTRIYGTANVDTSVYVGSSNNTTGTGGVLANNTVLLIGNNTINVQLSTTALNINTHFIANTTGVYSTGLVNATSFTVSTNTIANNTGLFVGTSNLIANSAGLFVANATGIVNAAVHQVGTTFIANSLGTYISTSNVIANSAGVFVANTTGIVNAAVHQVGAIFVANSTGTFIGTSNVIANSAGLFVANVTGVVSVVNSTGNSILTATTLKVANSTSNVFWVNTSTVAIGNAVGIFANGSVGTNGQVLTSNGTVVFWSPVADLPRVSSTISITSPLAWNSDNFDMYIATAQASSLTISADAGIPVNGQKMIFRFKDNGTAQTLSFTTGTANGFRAVGVALPTITTTSKTTYVGCIYNATDSRWDVIAVATEV
jgi:hypothetical protein